MVSMLHWYNHKRITMSMHLNSVPHRRSIRGKEGNLGTREARNHYPYLGLILTADLLPSVPTIAEFFLSSRTLRFVSAGLANSNLRYMRGNEVTKSLTMLPTVVRDY